MKQLSMIEPDVSRIFHSPLHPKLVRTGTIGDGSCFFHALCYTLFGKYRKLDIPERMNFVRNFRNKIVNSTSLEKYHSLGDGEIFRMQYILALRDIIQSQIHRLHYPFEHWDNTVLTKISNEWKSTDVDDAIDLIEDLVTDLDVDILERLFYDCEKYVFQMFRNHLSVQWADEMMMEIVSDFCRCNFYFINATNRRVYKMFESPTQYDRNAVFCWVEESHYECIGELKEGNSIKRVFSNEDELIQNILKNIEPAHQ